MNKFYVLQNLLNLSVSGGKGYIALLFPRVSKFVAWTFKTTIIILLGKNLIEQELFLVGHFVQGHQLNFYHLTRRNIILLMNELFLKAWGQL